MQAIDVSVQNTVEKYDQRVWLILHDFTRDGSGNIKYFTQEGGNTTISALFKITRGQGRGAYIQQVIPISGENAATGRAFIRDTMEASGFAKRENFHSYSIQCYEELIRLHFPAYVSVADNAITQVISPYKALHQMEGA
jgi:hypothetical protein